jgi:hypothetical protein
VKSLFSIVCGNKPEDAKELIMRSKLVVLVALLLLASYVFGQSEDDFDIMQNQQGGITITGYRGTTKQVVIPETIEGIRVTSTS